MKEHNQQLIRDFIQDCRLRGDTKSSVKAYESHMRIYGEFMTDKDLTEVEMDNLKDFLEYLNERGIKDGSIAHYFAAISSFYEYLVFERTITYNKVPAFRRRYLSKLKKNRGNTGSRRQLITVPKMRELVSVVIDPRDRAIIVLLAKTGVRVTELLNIDVSDIDWGNNSIVLKRTGKRSNCTVFFDTEGERALRRWLKVRSTMDIDNDALFVRYPSDRHDRLGIQGVENVVKKYARRIGIHKNKSDGGKLEERFTPHCCRHWFTTHLRRSGMPRDYIKWLRGDSMNDTMDIYNHIDVEDVRESYIQHIPKLLF